MRDPGLMLEGLMLKCLGVEIKPAIFVLPILIFQKMPTITNNPGERKLTGSVMK